MGRIDPDTVALLTQTIPAMVAPYIDMDAETGAEEWFIAVAAVSVRDAAALLHDILQDLT